MIEILIVEDEKPISDLLKLSLTQNGYHCTCVYDGLTAADTIDRDIFDLILLDEMLPDLSGFELMDYIRDLGIPVIFLTAQTDVSDRVMGLKMGAEDYVVNFAQLTQRAGNFLVSRENEPEFKMITA